MARITADQLKRRREQFLVEAGQAFDGMLGEDGGNGLVTFAEREDRACELGDALTRRLLEEHLCADDAMDSGAAADCPICGRPVACGESGPAELEKRSVQTRRGKIDFERAARRCTPCRRIFFPRR
jgi:hypothetical protein